MAQVLALALVGCGSVDLVGPTPDDQAAPTTTVPPADAGAPATAATGGTTGAVVATGGTTAPVATGGTTGAGGMPATTTGDDKTTPAAPDAGAAKDDGAKTPKDAETKMPKS